MNNCDHFISLSMGCLQRAFDRSESDKQRAIAELEFSINYTWRAIDALHAQVQPAETEEAKP